MLMLLPLGLLPTAAPSLASLRISIAHGTTTIAIIACVAIAIAIILASAHLSRGGADGTRSKAHLPMAQRLAQHAHLGGPVPL